MKKGRVLVAEDNGTIRKIIRNMLKAHYQFDLAEDGLEAWTLLEKDPEAYYVVVLDREMPEMNGMEVLAKIKEHAQLREIPVIFQTSMDSEKHILEGLQAGAYYYLPKPFSEEQLLSIIGGAYSDYDRYRTLRNVVKQNADTLQALRYMAKGNLLFHFSTIDEAISLATLIANVCPEPGPVVTGLMELFINAVEHGNLDISYDDKTELLNNDEWHSEVERRLALPEHASKKVTVQFERHENEVSFLIKDQGKGFEWEPYLEFDTGERAFDSHGRGIAMANKLSFCSVQYLGTGNEVLAVVKI